jgi:hypothetical protein
VRGMPGEWACAVTVATGSATVVEMVTLAVCAAMVTAATGSWTGPVAMPGECAAAVTVAVVSATVVPLAPSKVAVHTDE